MALRKKKKYKYDTQEIRKVDEELGARMEERRKVREALSRNKKVKRIVIALLAFFLLVGVCGRDIVRLKAENRALKRQHAALEKQRDELKEELETVDDQEYIREQARKQLRLLNPGEILFTFDDGAEGAAEDAAEDAGGGDE